MVKLYYIAVPSKHSVEYNTGIDTNFTISIPASFIASFTIFSVRGKVENFSSPT